MRLITLQEFATATAEEEIRPVAPVVLLAPEWRQFGDLLLIEEPGLIEGDRLFGCVCLAATLNGCKRRQAPGPERRRQAL